jgi:Flp pilus assembly CpaE family ATPase
MFNVPTLARSLTLPKIISGISKTLQIANQIIPLYQKAKPAITNAQKILKAIKEVNQDTKKETVVLENKTPIKKEKISSKQSPTFFL